MSRYIIHKHKGGTCSLFWSPHNDWVCQLQLTSEKTKEELRTTVSSQAEYVVHVTPRHNNIQTL